MESKTAIITSKVRMNNDVLMVTIPKKNCIDLGIVPGDLVLIKISKAQPPADF